MTSKQIQIHSLECRKSYSGLMTKIGWVAFLLSNISIWNTASATVVGSIIKLFVSHEFSGYRDDASKANDELELCESDPSKRAIVG